MISASVYAVYGGMILIGLALPILLALLWLKKTRQPVSVVLTGALVFFLFAIVLESLPKLLLFQTNNPVGLFVMSDTFRYMAIAALLAGIFEESGRFLAFKLVLKKRSQRETAISYGIGHGGCEVMYLLVLGGVQYLTYALLINAGQFDTILAQLSAVSPEQAAALEAIPQTLAETSFVTLLLAVMERVSALLIHLSCSIIVFKAAREQGKSWLYPLAILLHAAFDMAAACYVSGIITNLYLFETGLLTVALAFFVICWNGLYRKMPAVTVSEVNLADYMPQQG